MTKRDKERFVKEIQNFFLVITKKIKMNLFKTGNIQDYFFVNRDLITSIARKKGSDIFTLSY